MATIRKGDKGPEVERWQTLLASQGFDPNGIDGRFGTGTARATREFQRAHGLKDDAIVGKKTWAAAEHAATTVHTIQRGSRGADVEQWQRLLDSKGFDPNGIDGSFGPGTEKATKEFQRAAGLTANGVVESKTWSAGLGSKVKASPKPKPKSTPMTKSGSGFVKDQIDVSKVPLQPATRASGADRGVIRAWNRYGGILTELSGVLGIDPDAAAAVLAIESGGTGTTSSGPVIRFENHILWDRWGKSHPDKFKAHFRHDGSRRWRGHQYRTSAGGTWKKCHAERQPGEWKVYRFAAGLNEDAATTSMSIGLAQIMGFHYKRIGYAAPAAMLNAMASSEGYQILGLFDFVNTSSGKRLLSAIQNKDWYTFAKGYNGGGKFRDYGDKMKAAYGQLRAAK